MPERKRMEWVLNLAFNRWQLNRPRYVGKLSEAIRQCAPRNLDEWEQYYLNEVKPEGEMLADTMEKHLQEVGRRLYEKISQQLREEIEAITEQDCIRYVREVIIKRTYQGYRTEKRIASEQLQKLLGMQLEPAPDEWDRQYNVDFFVRVVNGVIGIQIKPITYEQSQTLHSWREWMKISHLQFETEYNGKVFIIFSAKRGGQVIIHNPEVVEEIRQEIIRRSQ